MRTTSRCHLDNYLLCCVCVCVYVRLHVDDSRIFRSADRIYNASAFILRRFTATAPPSFAFQLQPYRTICSTNRDECKVRAKTATQRRRHSFIGLKSAASRLCISSCQRRALVSSCAVAVLCVRPASDEEQRVCGVRVCKCTRRRIRGATLARRHCR